jgi:hypothetical protein
VKVEECEGLRVKWRKGQGGAHPLCVVGVPGYPITQRSGQKKSVEEHFAILGLQCGGGRQDAAVR